VITEAPDSIWTDYAKFHAGQASSQDLDPVYPVLRTIGDLLGLDKESRVWLTFLHVAYYHMGSALRVFQEFPKPGIPQESLLKLPTGTERRAHRVPKKLEIHFNSLCGIADGNNGLSGWVDNYIRPNPTASWNSVAEALTQPIGNGRWAAYKTSEMLWKVNNYDMAAPDMGHAHSSGPRQGLEILFSGLPTGNKPSDVRILDSASDVTIKRLSSYGITAAMEEAETSLCDFHALVEGRYYVGHDIDQMLEQLYKVPSDLSSLALDARSQVFDHAYLGELNNWQGIQKERKRIYRDTKVVALR
jgi:hypothetical protein